MSAQNEQEREWQQMLARSFAPADWFTTADRGESPGKNVTREDKIMWVYRPVPGQEDTFEVGYFTPSAQWVADSSNLTREEARSRVHWLNGGNR